MLRKGNCQLEENAAGHIVKKIWKMHKRRKKGRNSGQCNIAHHKVLWEGNSETEVWSWFQHIKKILDNLVSTHTHPFLQLCYQALVLTTQGVVLGPTASVSSWSWLGMQNLAFSPDLLNQKPLWIVFRNLCFNKCSRWLCRFLMFEKYWPTSMFFNFKVYHNQRTC